MKILFFLTWITIFIKFTSYESELRLRSYERVTSNYHLYGETKSGLKEKSAMETYAKVLNRVRMVYYR